MHDDKSNSEDDTMAESDGKSSASDDVSDSDDNFNLFSELDPTSMKNSDMIEAFLRAVQSSVVNFAEQLSRELSAIKEAEEDADIQT